MVHRKQRKLSEERGQERERDPSESCPQPLSSLQRPLPNTTSAESPPNPLLPKTHYEHIDVSYSKEFLREGESPDLWQLPLCCECFDNLFQVANVMPPSWS